jgi:hypothetical protein
MLHAVVAGDVAIRCWGRDRVLYVAPSRWSFAVCALQLPTGGLGSAYLSALRATRIDPRWRIESGVTDASLTGPRADALASD